MINEILFISSIFITIILSLCALRLGKEALVGAAVMQGVIANIFLVKEMELLGRFVTCADVFIVGLVLSLNLLHEYYGKKTASRAVNSYIFVLVWFLIIRTIHLLYEPSAFDKTHNHFVVILDHSLRIIASTVFVSWFALHLDRLIYKSLLNFFGHRFLGFKNLISISVSQLIDTVLFTYLALYGLITSVKDVILVSYLVKLFSVVLITPFLSLAQYFEPKKYD